MRNPDKTKIEPEFLIGAIILVVFVVLNSIQVFLRYVIGFSLPWVEELLAILLVWMTFICAAGLSKHRQHARVEIIEEYFSKKWVQSLEILYNIVTIVYLALITYGGALLWDKLRLQKTPAMRIPLRYVSIVVPATAVLMIVYYLRHIFHDLKTFKDGEQS